MGMWEDVVRRELGDLSTEVKRKLINELEDLGKGFLVPKVADAVSRTVIKSLDGVVATSVKLLSEEDAARFAAAYLVEVTDTLTQFAEALEAYLPYQLAVEQAKMREPFGSKSAAVKAARKARDQWIDEVRGEVRDIFRAIAGEEVAD